MGLTIRVDISEDDYRKLELRAWNERFAGTTLVHSDVMQLNEFAACIAGFPAKPGDERSFVFGERRDSVAGYRDGYCSLRFRTVGSAGRAVVDATVEADQHPDSPDKATSAKAEFSIPVQAADIDRFVAALHAIAEGRADEAGW